MSWVITGSQPIPAVIGEPFGGGYFAGYISHTADGNPTHALIVAPRETGATGGDYTLSTNLAWATNTTTNGINYSTTTIGANASNEYDGMSVMSQVVALGNIANFPAFEFCKNLSIGGYTDWYLPSRYELNIAYFNLKPSTGLNNISSGANNYSVPLRLTNYTSSYPSQTTVALFSGGSESFSSLDGHWSSTEVNANAASQVAFGSGLKYNTLKTATRRLRAFRRIAL